MTEDNFHWALFARADNDEPILVNIAASSYVLQTEPGRLFVSNCSYPLKGDLLQLAIELKATSHGD